MDKTCETCTHINTGALDVCHVCSGFNGKSKWEEAPIFNQASVKVVESGLAIQETRHNCSSCKWGMKPRTSHCDGCLYTDMGFGVFRNWVSGLGVVESGPITFPYVK